MAVSPTAHFIALRESRPVAVDERSPEKVTRRRVLAQIGAMAALGTGLPLIYEAVQPYKFDLEQEIASGDLEKYTSQSYSLEKQKNYTRLRAAIFIQDTRTIKILLQQPWAQKPDDEDRAVIAKAMAYTLTQDLPLKEKILQTILEVTPAAREALYITQKTVPDAHHAPYIKTFAEVAGQGYFIEVPHEKMGWAIKRDLDLGGRLAVYIGKLPEAGQAKAR